MLRKIVVIIGILGVSVSLALGALAILTWEITSILVASIAAITGIVQSYLPKETEKKPEVKTKETTPKQPSEIVHMKVLREHAIDPWINLLRGVDRGTVVIGGVVTIESSTMGNLVVDREVTVTLPRDPDFKYSGELFQHLSKGYPKQHRNWIQLKKDYSNYMKEAKSVFEAICTNLANEVSMQTGLATHDFRGQPPKEYFGAKHLSYIIYQDIAAMIKYGRKLFEGEMQVNEDREKPNVFFVSKGAFSRLVQGKKRQCENVIKIVDELEKDEQIRRSIETLVLKRKKLDNLLNEFIEFLEKLSKLIENQKLILGYCDMCSDKTQS